ncbi:MAG: Flp family type IVb pilin [Roseiarcus sp.]
MIKALFNFADDASGATAIEYALLALLIALPIIAALTIIGTNLSGTFNEVSSNFS